MKPDAPEAPRLLITRTDALGDVILTTPVYRALKVALPNCRVAALCRDYTEPVLRNNPHIDEVITITREDVSELPDLTRRIAQGRYDIALALYPSRFVATALKKARIPIRIGSARRFHSWKFTYRINQSRRRNEKSEAQYNLDLLRALNITSSDTRPEVFVEQAQCETAKKALQERGVAASFVALHPGSSGSAIDWPLEKFVQLAEELHRRGMTTIFTGNYEEQGRIENALERSSVSSVSLAGQTTLQELAATLELAEVVVANSTGPLHLAAAVGSSTVGLFPSNASTSSMSHLSHLSHFPMSPLRWAPPVSNTIILQPDSGSAALDISVTVVADAVMSARATMKALR